MDRRPVGTPSVTMSPAAGLSVVELRGDPGQSPLQVGEHELERLGPLLLRVELGFDRVRSTTAARVFNLALFNVHPGGQRGGGSDDRESGQSSPTQKVFRKTASTVCA